MENKIVTQINRVINLLVAMIYAIKLVLGKIDYMNEVPLIMQIAPFFIFLVLEIFLKKQGETKWES